MAAFWMCEVAPLEMVNSVAFNLNQLDRRDTWFRDTEPETGPVSVTPRRLQVMVVDDERDTSDLMINLLGHWGHAARLAYDGETGLLVAAIQHPDVVLLDISLPHMDGCQVARQLRLDFPREDCFIIAVTGRADEESRRLCCEAGIDLFLIKPVDPSVLEVLLMLEHMRVNRMRIDETVSLATKVAPQLAPKIRRFTQGIVPLSRRSLARLTAGVAIGHQLKQLS